jgi:hypothetical protein
MTGRGGSGSGDAERRLRVRMTERPARPGAGSSSSTLPPPRANSVPGRGEQPLGRSAAAQLSCRGLLPYVPVCAPSRTRTCCLLLRKSFRLRSRPADSGGEQDSRYPPVTVVAPVAGLFWHASGTGHGEPLDANSWQAYREGLCCCSRGWWRSRTVGKSRRWLLHFAAARVPRRRIHYEGTSPPP